MNESVKNWLGKFEINPSEEIHKLILGHSGVVAWAKSSLYECLLEISQTHLEELDAAVADWLYEYVGGPPPDKTPEIVWHSILEELRCSICNSCLKKSKEFLNYHYELN